MGKNLGPLRQRDEVRRAVALPSLAVSDEAVPAEFSDVGHFHEMAVEAWHRSQREVIRFGRILRSAKASFEHGTFMEALDRIAETVGEDANKLRRFMRVAEAIDDRILPGPAAEWEAVPAKADEVQALVRKLDPERLAEAKAAGIISPAAPVREIRAYAKALTERQASAVGPSKSDLLRRLSFLEQRMKEIQTEAEAIRRQLDAMG